MLILSCLSFTRLGLSAPPWREHIGGQQPSLHPTPLTKTAGTAGTILKIVKPRKNKSHCGVSRGHIARDFLLTISKRYACSLVFHWYAAFPQLSKLGAADLDISSAFYPASVRVWMLSYMGHLAGSRVQSMDGIVFCSINHHAGQTPAMDYFLYPRYNQAFLGCCTFPFLSFSLSYSLKVNLFFKWDAILLSSRLSLLLPHGSTRSEYQHLHLTTLRINYKANQDAVFPHSRPYFHDAEIFE